MLAQPSLSRVHLSILLILAAAAQARAAEPVAPVVRELQGPDGRIPCTVYAPQPIPKDNAGLVVHLYGGGGSHTNYNISRPSYDELRKQLAERGYWLVVPDLGPFHWMNDAACAQIDAVIAELVEHEKVDPARVHLLGTSMGGGSSLIYVARRPGKIKSVVSVFPMTDFAQWLNERPGYRAAFEKSHGISLEQREEALAKLSPLHHPEAYKKTPVFLLHGDQDPVVPPHHSRDFAAALKEKGFAVTYREVAGGVHQDTIAQDHQQELADFLTKGTTSAEPVAPVVRELPGPDGKTPCVVYAPLPIPKDKAGLVVHLYGSGGSLTSYNVGSPSYDDFRKLLAERGYWLVVPDLGPAHWMNEAACAKVDTVIAEMVESENVDPARVNLLGTSMGGGSSLIYVARRPGKIKSVVSVFPMTDFTQWLAEAPGYRGRFETAHGISPEQRETALAKVSPLRHPEAYKKTSVFLLHGDNDAVVPPHHSRDFAAALKKAGCDVIYREVPGETHRDEISQKYQQELADFLTKVGTSTPNR